MTLVPRPPLIFRTWPKDPSGAAINALDRVRAWGPRYLLSKDKFFGLAGHTNFDWPLPMGRDRRSCAWPSLELRTWINTLEYNLKGQDRMLPQYDWGLPSATENQNLRAPLVAWYNKNLIGKDTLPFRQREWPVPPGPKRAVDLSTWSIGFSINIVPVASPFVQEDWPVPRGPMPINRGFTAWYNLNLISQDHLPFVQDDWPVPKAPQQGSIALRTWTHWYNLNLISQDQLPFSQEDWPVPRAPGRVIDLITWSIGFSLNLVPTASPFAQSDWPVPRGAPPLNRGWLNWYTLSLIGQDQLPFSQESWPVPPAPARASDLRTWSMGFQVNLTTAQSPFSQGDWPVPRGPMPTYLRTWLERYNLNLVAQDALPFRQTEWPVPKPPQPGVIDNRTWLFALPVNLAVIFKPFAQTEWPIPRGPTYAISLRTWVDQVRRQLIGRDTIAFRQPDWPVPPPYRRLVVLTWLDQIRRQLIGKDSLPFRQPDWPVPPPKRQHLQYTALRVGFSIQFGFVAPPFFQTSWPNPPPGPPRRNEPLGITQVRVRYLTAQAAFYQVYIVI